MNVEDMDLWIVGRCCPELAVLDSECRGHGSFDREPGGARCVADTGHCTGANRSIYGRERNGKLGKTTEVVKQPRACYVLHFIR